MTEPDQWTLQADGVMPLHRFTLEDDEATVLYVSEVTGDVELRTTRRFRLKRVQMASPYAGLLFGVVTLTWTYSGLLSMGPFNWFQGRPMTRAQREASTGGPLRLDLLTLESARAAATAVRVKEGFVPRELEVMQFRGEPHWVTARHRRTRVALTDCEPRRSYVPCSGCTVDTYARSSARRDLRGHRPARRRLRRRGRVLTRPEATRRRLRKLVRRPRPDPESDLHETEPGSSADPI